VTDQAATIRRFEDDDARAVSRLIASAVRAGGAGYTPPEVDELVAHYSTDRLRGLAAQRHCLVAERDGRVVATAALDELDTIVTFFVDPAEQGRGTGTRLLHMLEAVALGAEATVLGVATGEGGSGFFERAGFRRLPGVRTGPAVPQVMLVKDLDEARYGQ
jgi:N-acetylglutamate synthase-like GNAT family acetyltransferase